MSLNGVPPPRRSHSPHVGAAHAGEASCARSSEELVDIAVLTCYDLHMILTPPATNTRQLTWVPKNREYVGEMSSTNGFGRVYDDACDEGMTLVSSGTGATLVFVVDHTERDVEGDVKFWLLRPVDPRLDAFTVRIFND